MGCVLRQLGPGPEYFKLGHRPDLEFSTAHGAGSHYGEIIQVLLEVDEEAMEILTRTPPKFTLSFSIYLPRWTRAESHSTHASTFGHCVFSLMLFLSLKLALLRLPPPVNTLICDPLVGFTQSVLAVSKLAPDRNPQYDQSLTPTARMNIWERARGMADHHRLALVFAILEVLTLLCKACGNEHYDEVWCS